MSQSTTVYSHSLGRAVRLGSWQEQCIPTSELALAGVRAGDFARGAELSSLFVDEAAFIFGFMTDCARRAKQHLLGLGVPASELAAAERAIDELLRWADGSPYDADAFWARVTSARDDAVSACEEGGEDGALAAINNLVDTWRSCHDRVVDSLCGVINEVLVRFGEEAVGALHHDIFKAAIFDVRYQDYEYSERSWDEAFDDLVYLACEAMRAHMGGPQRDGAMELEELDDRVVMRFAPCGSGGRTLQSDPVDLSPPRREPPFGWAQLEEAHEFTWGKKGVCAYCAHCCVVMEQLSIDQFGYPMRVVDPPERGGVDGDVKCTWTMFRDPWAVPEERYRRVGRVKPSPPRPEQPA